MAIASTQLHSSGSTTHTHDDVEHNHNLLRKVQRVGSEYSCPWPGCTHSTRQRSNLKTHYMRHTGERPHACPDHYEDPADPTNLLKCTFKTSDPASLTRHRKRLHGYQPRPRGASAEPLTLTNEESAEPNTTDRPHPYARKARRETPNPDVPLFLQGASTAPEKTKTGSRFAASKRRGVERYAATPSPSNAKGKERASAVAVEEFAPVPASPTNEQWATEFPGAFVNVEAHQFEPVPTQDIDIDIDAMLSDSNLIQQLINDFSLPVPLSGDLATPAANDLDSFLSSWAAAPSLTGPSTNYSTMPTNYNATPTNYTQPSTSAGYGQNTYQPAAAAPTGPLSEDDVVALLAFLQADLPPLGENTVTADAIPRAHNNFDTYSIFNVPDIPQDAQVSPSPSTPSFDGSFLR